MKPETSLRTLEARFWKKVIKGEGCWRWTGAKTERGYGLISIGREHSIGAHRVSFTLAGGTIPEGYTIDHLCRNPNCVRPDHLEAVTQAENNARAARFKTHCVRGHSFEGDHVRMIGDRRICKECRRLRQLESRRANAAANPGLGSGSYQRAKTECPQGHPYDSENTYVAKRGSRMCRTCMRARCAARRAASKAAA